MDIAKRLLFIALTALYALSVAVQYNDPDPVPWVAIYGAAAALTAAAVARRPLLIPAVIVGLIALVWMITLLPAVPEYISQVRSGALEVTSFTMKTGVQIEEEAREAGGLFLVVLGAVLVGWEARLVAPRADRR
jgi:hypothetical protein